MNSNETSSWALPEDEPTALIALWPGDTAPTMTEVLAAFGAHIGRDVRVVDELDPEDPSVLFCAVIDVPGREEPVLLWAEPARPLADDELDDPAARACRWVVGVETVLDTDDPHASFWSLMRLIAEPFEDVPAIADLNSERWHPRESLDRALASGVEPPLSVLWMIHVVQWSDADDDTGAWIHTHGLQRCGLPELEMLEVPPGCIEPAVALLETIAGRLLDGAVPAPGEPYAVGPQLQVTLEPWQDAAPRVTDAPGGPDDRTGEDNPHVGVGAVICASREVLDCIERGQGAYFLSPRESERQARLAQAGWPELAGAFSKLRDEDVQFYLKAGLAGGEDGREREHLWFVVRRIEGDRAEAELLNPPCLVTSIRKGDVTWIERHMVSDWSVATRRGSIGPGEVDRLDEEGRS